MNPLGPMPLDALGLQRDLRGIGDALERVRQRLVREVGVPYTSQDGRQVAMEAMQLDVAACTKWLQAMLALRQMCHEKDADRWEHEYRERLSIHANIPTGAMEDIMLDYLRNTLPVRVHFTIENLFSNLLGALGVRPKGSGYYPLSSAILEGAGIGVPGPEKDTLTALANLRNSFHGNGIHRKGGSLSVVIDGQRFEFHEGKRVECASWRHVTAAIVANVRVVEAVLFSDRASGLKKVVDAFAEHYDTGEA